MTIAISAVAALAYYDQRSEAHAALEDFADDQAWLADALSRALGERLHSVERDLQRAAVGMHEGTVTLDGARIVAGDDTVEPRAESFIVDLPNANGDRLRAHVALAPLLASVRSFERAGDVRVLVQPPGRDALLSTDGSAVRADAIARALGLNLRSIVISRDDAVRFGLPPRMAMAGLARIAGGALGTWNVVVVATAQSERDREERSRGRLLLAVVVAGGLVLAFGGIALRIRTKELELEHALTLGEIAAERDEKLGEADKLATMCTLAIGIAHEVSTPLAVILARAEQIVRRSRDDERARHGAEAIVAETERIDQVIRGFLSLVRGDAARLERAAAHDVADSAVALVSHRFAKAAVVLETRNDAGADVACDRALFEQAIVNLLLNACDACTAGGHVTFTVRSDGERVAFVVVDDGEGLPAAAAERVVEPFFTTKPDGTGLGLAIAAEIVKHHRGALLIRARDDARGTIAVVELPAARVSEGSDA